MSSPAPDQPSGLPWAGWAVLACVPAAVLLNEGRGRHFMIVLAGTLVAAALLWAALRRDPDGSLLRGLASTRSGKLFGILWATVLLVLAVAPSGSDFTVVLVGSLIAALTLWLVHRSTASLVSTVQNFLLLCGALGFVLVVGEMVMRQPFIVEHTGGSSPGSRNWDARFSDRLWTRTILGFRSHHLDEPKPAGTSRIVSLGDSYTWGHRVALTEDIWPYRLESRLVGAGEQVQVVNLARPGMTTVNQAELLERLGWRFEPDMVILQYTINDVLPSSPNLGNQPGSWYFKTRMLLPVAHDLLDRRSYLYSYLNGRFLQLQVALGYPDGWSPLYDDDSEGWIASQEAMAAIGEWTRERELPRVLVIFPMFVPGPFDSEHYPYADIHAKVAAAGQRAGFEVIDLFDIYAAEGRDGRSFWALPDDSHPGAEAQAMAADEIFRRLAELGWPPDVGQGSGAAAQPESSGERAR